MSGIFGLFHRQGAPVEPGALRAMEEAMSCWGPDGRGLWQDGPIGLGQMLLYNTPEALYERLPRWLPEQKLAFTAEARIDNRDELCDIFDIARIDRHQTSDGDLIIKAYLKWGEECPDHLLGDWAFAVWYPDERRLFLARDHQGNTSLYYFYDGKTFAFASGKQALLALPQVPRTLNELKIAQILVSWHGDGIQTVYEAIRCLPPSYTLTVTPEAFRLHRFWILEETPMLPPRSDASIIEGFLDVYNAAVRARLRSYRPIGSALSGGLDSGSVTAVAARELGAQGRRLSAFTSVPLYNVEKTVGKNRFGDEAPLAKATADFAQNIDHFLLRAENVSPSTGIRRMLDIHSEPSHASVNHYWIIDLLEAARSRGIGTLLTGQGGNATISWTGMNYRPRLGDLVLARNLGNILKQKIVRPLLPTPLARRLKIRQKTGSWKLDEQPWLAYSAIRPDFARRVALYSRMAESGHDPYFLSEWRDGRHARLAILKPGRNISGVKWAENGAGFGFEVRDPTLDKRVMEYSLGLPEKIFQNVGTNGRGLIRRAMIGYLPDPVRLNRCRGMQAADIEERIRHEAPEMHYIMSRLAASPFIGQVLDIKRLENTLRSIETRSNKDTTQKASMILLRSLGVGLFLDQQMLVYS